ncbi:hypothetical protein O181_051322 [Austropuccinia psidii MF-1]|uniref:Uncharacterized protein n=1 Tax=Austropuccinia psidii MF-1 TaxID=1389203 RepID=A0A9Q3E5H3_9BASI|nr:hypothetical protein [Austropuccinia psidii MF-1]
MINNKCIVKSIRRVSNSPTDPDELDGEEVEVMNKNTGQTQNSSPSHPPSKTFESQVIPSTSANFQPRIFNVPSSVHQSSPHPSNFGKPGLASPMRPSPVPQPRPYPMPPSSNLQTVDSTSNRSRDERFPLAFPAVEVSQRREHWKVRVTREDPNVVTEPQYAVSRPFRSVYRNHRQMIFYENDRIIP